MKFSLLSAIAAAVFVPFTSATPLASTADLSYDTHYDDPSLPLSGVTCSDGDNGMITKGYNTAGEIPNYPHVGGAFTVETWNSPNCGKCYKVTYNAKTIFLTAIDHSNSGFNIAKKSMDVLTNRTGRGIGQDQGDLRRGRLVVVRVEIKAYWAMCRNAECDDLIFVWLKGRNLNVKRFSLHL
nr:19 kDa antigen [Coccidioides posadasii]